MMGEYVKNHKVNQPFTCILPTVPLKELNTSVIDQTFAKSKDYEFCIYIMGKITPTNYRILIFSTSLVMPKELIKTCHFCFPTKRSELKNFQTRVNLENEFQFRNKLKV